MNPDVIEISWHTIREGLDMRARDMVGCPSTTFLSVFRIASPLGEDEVRTWPGWEWHNQSAEPVPDLLSNMTYTIECYVEDGSAIVFDMREVADDMKCLNGEPICILPRTWVFV